MKDDFGYFGSGWEGYVQYMEAYKRISDDASIPDGSPGSEAADMEPEQDDFAKEEADTDFEDDNTQYR